MRELLTAAQMRAIEQAAIESGEVTGLELMERAGAGVVEAIFEEWPELKATSHRAVVLCGPGNNGGDGFVVARLLKEWGWEVEVYLYGDPDKLPPDARVNYQRWCALGEVTDLALFDRTPYLMDGYLKPAKVHLAIDALFGTGLARGLSDDLDDALSFFQPALANAQGEPRVVAVDIPSGLCANSGREIGDVCGAADLTVSFHSEKIGHRLNVGPEVCGKVAVKSIGLDESLKGRSRQALADFHELPATGKGLGRAVARRVSESDLPPYLSKESDEHKYSHGHALIFSGPMGRSGAARLAARGALRIGAGLVTLAAPGSSMMECAAQLTAIMLRKCDDAEALAELLQDTRLNALCLGPGLGVERAKMLVPTILADKRSTLLDADALTAYANDPDALFSLLHTNCVLTPHGGEFARLFPDLAAKLADPAAKGPAYSKIDATGEAAKRAGCTVLFKGPDTVIADEKGHGVINSSAYDRAAPWLATAGSGDVLAGFITGLLARGFSAQQAAETGAWLHTECALQFGPGLIAEDLPEQLPAIFKALKTDP